MKKESLVVEQQFGARANSKHMSSEATQPSGAR